MTGSTNSNHSPLSTLFEYHRLGFKPVPIGEDGVTPNVNGLLTPEERENCIRESKNGKEEPVLKL